MSRDRIMAVVFKDLKAVVSSKMVLIPMIIVPVLLCIVIPTFLLILALRVDTVLISGVEFVEKLIPLYPVPADLPGTVDRVLYIFLNFTFLPYFMLVPIMASSIIAANSIVGEKERKTLETLLYTPITNREFLAAKLLGSFLPAVLVSWLGFAGYFLSLNLVYYLMQGALIIRAWIWLPAVLLLSPSVSLLGLSITLLVSLRAKTYTEAQQMAGIIVLPFILLIVIQMTGLVIFNAILVVLFALLLGFVSYILILRLAPRFSRERIIGTL